MTDTVIVQSLKEQIRSTTVVISTVATPLPSERLNYRKTITIKNINSIPVYLGGSDVDTSNGYPIYTRESIDIDLDWNTLIYAIASTTINVKIMEFS